MVDINQKTEWMNIAQVSNTYGFSKSWIYKACASRRLKHYKPNGRLIFNRGDIEAHFRSTEITPAHEIEAGYLNGLVQQKSTSPN